MLNRGLVRVQRSRRGREVVCWVLRVDAILDGVALDLDVVLFKGESLARGDPQLPAHDVDPRHLRDSVFDLNAGVHFHEVELAIFDEELDGPCVGVVGCANTFAGSFADLLPEVGVERRTRCLLDDFLVATLERTVPFAEVADVTVPICQYLYFDVFRCFEVLLDVYRIVAEVRFALALSAFERVVDFGLAANDLHPRPPPPPSALIAMG